MKPNILHAIFFDKFQNWQSFLRKHSRRIRPVVKKEVRKFQFCGDIRRGYRLLVCEGCHDVRLVPLKCKGKFCLTCATGESRRWAEITANDMLNVMHRHVVFTIDEGLRPIFMMEKYRDQLLKGLMDEAAKIVLNFFRKKKIQAGIVAALHTFGSQLEFNPHVHMVVTMGGVTNDGKWEECDYLPYKMLRVHWQNAVLKLIRRTLSKWDKGRVQSRLQAAYKNNNKGFYVNAPKRSRTNVKGLLEYISRYMKRGPIALNRIIMYDGDQVMFHYKDKRTNRTETKTMTAEEFIGAMTRQIQNHHFRTIRRYGIYSRRLKNLMKTILQAYQSQVKKMIIAVKNALKPKKWAERLTEEFGENPLECSKCGEVYEVLGMSVRKNSHLMVKYAKNKQAIRFMREENRNIEQKEFQYEYEKEKAQAFSKLRFDWERESQIYLSQMWRKGGYSKISGGFA